MNNYKEAWGYIKSDFVRYGERPSLSRILIHAIITFNHCFKYTFWLRLAKVKGWLYPLTKAMTFILTRKYGIQIPINTKIGYGFYIGHGIGIVVNSTVTVGNDVNISQFTAVGSHGKAAVIGNNVYIGPSVCIVNDVIIGNEASIGAGAVIVKDIPPFATVAGVPTKILHYENPGQFVNNRCKVDHFETNK